MTKIRDSRRLKHRLCECGGYLYFRPLYNSVVCKKCNDILMKNITKEDLVEWL